jgi:hypothetical protein
MGWGFFVFVALISFPRFSAAVETDTEVCGIPVSFEVNKKSRPFGPLKEGDDYLVYRLVPEGHGTVDAFNVYFRKDESPALLQIFQSAYYNKETLCVTFGEKGVVRVRSTRPQPPNIMPEKPVPAPTKKGH